MSLVQIVCEYLESLILSEREPLKASLCVPCSDITSLRKDAVGLIDTRSLICTLDVCIPFRMELIVEIGYDGQLLGILSCDRSQSRIL